MQIGFIGSSLLSAYWNGAATYYRGMIRALAARGHRVTFYEPDAFNRQANRDIEPPEWAEVVVWPATEEGAGAAVDAAVRADVTIKASGVGVFDAWLEQAVIDRRRSGGVALFWDVDAPATLARLEGDTADRFHQLVPRYDAILTYGGGEPVIEAYRRFGARLCQPIYNAMDAETHHPVEPDAAFVADLAFIGNRLPDREARVESFFFRAAELLPERRFLIGGSGWADRAMPPNVRALGHVFTTEHNRINCSALAVLNVSRDNMAETGFSPATRVFEAAAAGACLITDSWRGVEQFFEPEREILVAADGAEVAALLTGLDRDRSREIGRAARLRALADHSYDQRAAEVEGTLERVLGERVEP